MTDKEIKKNKINELKQNAITGIIKEFQKLYYEIVFTHIEILMTKVKYEIKSSSGFLFVFSFPFNLKNKNLKNKKEELKNCLDFLLKIDDLIGTEKIKQISQKKIWSCNRYHSYGYNPLMQIDRGGHNLKITKESEIFLNGYKINERDIIYHAKKTGFGETKTDFISNIKLLFGLPFWGELIPIENL